MKSILITIFVTVLSLNVFAKMQPFSPDIRTFNRMTILPCSDSIFVICCDSTYATVDYDTVFFRSNTAAKCTLDVLQGMIGVKVAPCPRQDTAGWSHKTTSIDNFTCFTLNPIDTLIFTIKFHTIPGAAPYLLLQDQGCLIYHPISTSTQPHRSLQIIRPTIQNQSFYVSLLGQRVFRKPTNTGIFIMPNKKTIIIK